MNKKRNRHNLKTLAPMSSNRNAVHQCCVKNAPLESWTGKHIAALVRLYSREMDTGNPNPPYLSKLEKLIEYLYTRGATHATAAADIHEVPNKRIEAEDVCGEPDE